MNENAIDEELVHCLNSEDMPRYARITMISVLDTRRKLGYLECTVNKIYRIQIGIFTTLVASLIVYLITRIYV